MRVRINPLEANRQTALMRKHLADKNDVHCEQVRDYAKWIADLKERKEKSGRDIERTKVKFFYT